MAGPLTITTVLLLAVSARADYDCLCNYHVETRLYARPDSRLSPVGYLYEFDCQPIVLVAGLDPRWQAVAKDHVKWRPIVHPGECLHTSTLSLLVNHYGRANKHINYVLIDNELKLLACAGNPPAADMPPTTSTTHTTSVRTTTTAVKKSTGKTNPTSTKHTSLKANNTTTTYSSSHQTSIPSTTIVSSRTATVTHTPKTTYTAANSFPSTTYTPSTVSMFKSTQTETKNTLTRKQTDRVSQSSTSHTSNRPTITTDPTLHTYSITGPTLHSDSTRPSTSSLTYSVHTTDLTQHLNNTSSSVMVHTVPITKLSSSVTYVSTTGVSVKPIHLTGSSSKSPTTVKFETTTVDSSTRNTTTKTVTTTSTQPPIYTTTSVGFHKSTVEPADISPDMSETILFLLNEERSLRAKMDSDADKLEAEITTLTRLRQNATCGCPAPVSAPIAFSAVLTHNIATLGLEQVIVFDHVYTNYGNGYDVRHGVFTAPVDGAYDFTVAMLMHAGKWSGVEIVVNTTPLAKTRSGDDSFYTMGTNSVAVQLKAGDEVYVRHINEADNNVIYGESFSSFTGYLIG